MLAAEGALVVICLRNRGIRATTIMPAAVNTEILDKRPRPPTAEERAMLIGSEDVAAAILLAVTLPERTVIEEIVMSPRVSRDQGADMEVALRLAEPGWTPPRTSTHRDVDGA